MFSLVRQLTDYSQRDSKNLKIERKKKRRNEKQTKKERKKAKETR